MLTLPPGARVLLATSRVDGRKGINGLSALVRSQFLMDPLSGTLFVFFTKRADIVRVLYWDRDGYVRLQLELPFVAGASPEPSANDTRATWCARTSAKS
jgi:transposase